MLVQAGLELAALVEEKGLIVWSLTLGGTFCWKSVL